MEALRVLRREGARLCILGEGRRVGDLLWLLPEVELEVECGERAEVVGPDRGDRPLGTQGESRAPAVAQSDPQCAAKDVDAHAHHRRTIRQGPRREPVRVEQQPRMQPLGLRWRQGERRLAEHLGRSVQRPLRRRPLRVGERRPLSIGIRHVSSDHGDSQTKGSVHRRTPKTAAARAFGFAALGNETGFLPDDPAFLEAMLPHGPSSP